MGLITKLAWVALPALAGCSVLSQVSSQGTGTSPGGKASGLSASAGLLPATYKGPAIPSLNSVEQKIAFLDDAKAVYAQANFRPKWIDTVPEDFRNWENGARQTLANNGRPLTYAQVEHTREVVRNFAKYDQRLSREASFKLLEPLPKTERDTAMAKVVFAVTKDALNYAGVTNPSKQMVQVAFSDASAYWANRFVKYDTAVTDKYMYTLKYWPNEPIELSVGDCNFFALAQRNVQRAGAKVIPELKGLQSFANGGSFVDVGQLNVPNGHVFVVTSLPLADGKQFKIIHNPTATDSDNTLTLGITRIGMTEAEMALFTGTFAPRISLNSVVKFFHPNSVGGEAPVHMNLGNLNLRYIQILNNPYAVPPLTEDEKVRMRRSDNLGVSELSHRTDWDSWRSSNESGLAKLRQTIYGR